MLVGTSMDEAAVTAANAEIATDDVDFLRHLAMRRFFIIRSRRSTNAATFISCNLPSKDACLRYLIFAMKFL